MIYLAEVVQKVDNAIDRINLYPLDSAIGFPNTCPLDSDLSGGHCYPSFEQPGPGGNFSTIQLLNNQGQINRYPSDKYLGNQLRYPVDSGLSADKIVVGRPILHYLLDSFIHPLLNNWGLTVSCKMMKTSMDPHLVTTNCLNFNTSLSI